MQPTTPHTFTPEAVQHSNRFRKVSTLFPHMVARAYDRDLARAMADTDEQVLATVAAWEQANGLEPQDWQAIGRTEHDPDRDD